MTSWICLQITSRTLHLSNTRGWEIHINSLLPSRIILRLRCRDFGSRVRNPQCWIVGYLGIAVGEIYFSIAAGAFPITLPIYAYFIPNILGEVDNETAVLAGFVAKAPTRKFHLDKSKRIQTKPIAFHCAWWVPPQKKKTQKNWLPSNRYFIIFGLESIVLRIGWWETFIVGVETHCFLKKRNKSIQSNRSAI